MSKNAVIASTRRMGLRLLASALAILLLPSVLLAEIIDYNVGAYYYPWYTGGGFHEGRTDTIEYHLTPRQQPSLGWYDQDQPAVVSRHYDWARYAGVNYFVCSWWGEGSKTDVSIVNNMFDNPDRGEIKLAAFLEPSITNATVYAQTAYLADNYFNRDGYYEIDGKPVVYVYITRAKTKSELQDYVTKMRQAARDAGYDDIYIVGDEVWGSGSNYDRSRINGYLDAITNYDVYGNMGGSGNSPYVSSATVELWDTRNDRWQGIADSLGIDFIPAVSPGFNDTAVRTGHLPISRKIDDESSEFGSLFEAQLAGAKDNTDADIGRAVMVTSWNEWHEDTQIEPVSGGAVTNVDDSASGDYFTHDIYYEAYGTRYLDILRDQLAPTLLGDLNDDRAVSSADLDIVRANWGQPVEPGCLQCGDPSGDGMVDGADLDIVRANWGTAMPAAIPEPGLGVLVVVGVGFLGCSAFRPRLRRNKY